MHVVLTGSTGLLGRAIVARFELRTECRLTALVSTDSTVSDSPGSRRSVPNLYSGVAVAEIIAELEPDRVIHAGALASPAVCEQDPNGARISNVDLTRAVAEGSRRCGAHLTLVSTDLVFESLSAPPGGYKEDAQTCPASVYGRTKRDAEEIALESHNSAVVRTSLLMGVTGAKNRGALGWIFDGLASGRELTLFDDEYRTPVDVFDAAEAIVRLSTDQQPGTWHVGGPQRLSRVEIAQVVADAFGFRDPLFCIKKRAQVPSSPARAADVSLDSSKIFSYLGRPTRSLPEFLPIYADDLRSDGSHTAR